MQKQVFNPYLPSYEYIPDGEPRIFGDRLYVYGSHDRFNGTNYCENDYICWSTPIDDLSNWHYEGIIFRKEDHPQDDIHVRTRLYAPDVIQGLDGRFYLYYSMCDSSIMSVAVCDTPAGHYQYLGDIHDADGTIIGNRPGDLHQFDPSIFIDDDGRIYLYSGFAPQKDVDEFGVRYAGCHVTELESDMMTIKKGPTLMIPKEDMREEKAAYFEAPSMRKINGIYYFVYSARVTGLFYYYSHYPDRDFTFGGRIHSTSDVGLNDFTEEYPAYPVGNIHGGIVCIHGTYYIFDHRHTNNSSYQRQGVAEPLTFTSDGKILQSEATSCGLNGGPLQGVGTYPAYIACQLYRLPDIPKGTPPKPCMSQDIPDTEPPVCDTPPVQYIRDIGHHTVVGYKYFEMQESVSCITCIVRGTANGTLSVRLSANEPEVGSIHLALHTAHWTTVSIQTDIPVGTHALYFTYVGEGTFDLQQFTLQQAVDYITKEDSFYA